MTISDKLTLLEQTKEAQKVKLGLPKNLPFNQYIKFIRDPFTTPELYKNGEQGVWLDTSDLSTMFQDVDGIEPVTKDGYPVGLIFDKSQGLFGSSYIDFDLLGLNPESANSYSIVTHNNGAVIYDITEANTSNAIYVPTTVSASRNKVFAVTLDIENLSSSEVLIKTGGSGAAPTFATLKANGHLRGTFTFKTDSIRETRLYLRTSRAKLKVNSVKIKEVKGNHATQSVASARPIYRTDGKLHWLECDGVDDTLTAQLPSGTYTEIKASRDGVTHKYPVNVNGSYTLGDLTQTKQSVSGLVLVNRQLTPDEIENVTNLMKVKAGLPL